VYQKDSSKGKQENYGNRGVAKQKPNTKNETYKTLPRYRTNKTTFFISLFIDLLHFNPRKKSHQTRLATVTTKSTTTSHRPSNSNSRTTAQISIITTQLIQNSSKNSNTTSIFFWVRWKLHVDLSSMNNLFGFEKH
jgi:hypothetical protein